MPELQKILLVDDEPGVRESVQAYLEDDEALKVQVASNANEAWDLLQYEVPNLVISDIMMPQVDGYQFLHKLRNDPRFQTLPVVFLTARGMTSDRIEGYKAGCDAYLPKPFDPEELEVIVKNLLERQRINAEANSDNSKLEEIAQEIKEIKERLGEQPNLVTTPHRSKLS